MTDKDEQAPAAIPALAPGVRNLGEPLRFKDAEPLAGFRRNRPKLARM